MRPTIAHTTFTLAGLNSQNTKRAYARALDLFVQWLDEQSSPALSMNRDTILLYLDNLRDSHEQEDGRPKSPQYYAQTLAALKRLAKHMSESNEGIDYPTYAAIKGIEPAKVKRVVYGELITDDMLKSLLTACLSDGTIKGVRDAAIIALLSATGMRRGELCSLDIENYNERSKILTIQETKNSEDRLAYLNPGAAQYLSDWLAILGGSGETWQNEAGETMGSYGPLFRKIRLYPSKKERPELILSSRLKDSAVYNMLKQRAIQTGIEDSFTPHDFRKTFISQLLNSGETDPMTIARLTGHKSIETIQLYDLTVDNRAKKAAQAIKTPYIACQDKDA